MGGQLSGHGLTGMAERAAAVGGSFSAAAGADGGFVVVARLPAAGPDPSATGQTAAGQTADGEDAESGVAPVAARDPAR